MLASGKMVGFVPTKDYDKARAFYEGKLGCDFVSLDQFALVMSVGGHKIRIAKIPNFTPLQGTILGWEVQDHPTRSVTWLRDRGVILEKYPFAQDQELGIWTAPGGDQVAWFKDPDGNILGISQHAESCSKIICKSAVFPKRIRISRHQSALRLGGSMTKSLLLGAILGGLTAFIWSSISWEVLGWHEKPMLAFQNEDEVVSRHRVPRHAIRHLPSSRRSPPAGLTAEQKKAAQAAQMAKMQKGPIVFAAVRTRRFRILRARPDHSASFPDGRRGAAHLAALANQRLKLR